MSTKSASITETEFGRFKAVVRDGEETWLFECPGCSKWAELDDDQWEGRVSVQHECGYHETHNFFIALAVAGNRPYDEWDDTNRAAGHEHWS